MRKIALGVAAAALFGCQEGNGGIYLIQMPTTVQENCDTTVNHNFIDAEVPEEVEFTSDWDIELEEAFSDSLYFAQIVQGKKGDHFLVAQGNVFPGVKENGGYTFEWVNFDEVDEYESYEPSPYTYSEVASRTFTRTFRLDKAKEFKGFDGTLTGTVVLDERYEESDLWDASVPVGHQMNNVAPAYLVDTSGEQGNYNWRDETDCTGSSCYLEVNMNCSGSASFTATWTGYAEESTYEYLRSVQQNAGF